MKDLAIEYVKISKLKPNPLNTNDHPDKQIDLLSEIIDEFGFRFPVVVSNRSGCLVKGHASVMAAQKSGLEEVPAIYQDFKDEKEEFSVLTADNEISRWSTLNDELVKKTVQRLDIKPKRLKLLGIKNLSISKVDFYIKDDKKPIDPIAEEMAKQPPKKDKEKKAVVCKANDVWYLNGLEIHITEKAIPDQADKIIEFWQNLSGSRAILENMDKPFEEVAKIRDMNDGKVKPRTKLK